MRKPGTSWLACKEALKSCSERAEKAEDLIIRKLELQRKQPPHIGRFAMPGSPDPGGNLWIDPSPGLDTPDSSGALAPHNYQGLVFPLSLEEGVERP